MRDDENAVIFVIAVTSCLAKIDQQKEARLHYPKEQIGAIKSQKRRRMNHDGLG